MSFSFFLNPYLGYFAKCVSKSASFRSCLITTTVCHAILQDLVDMRAAFYYTIIDFNEVDIRIYLPEKVIIH